MDKDEGDTGYVVDADEALQDEQDEPQGEDITGDDTVPNIINIGDDYHNLPPDGDEDDL